MCLTEPLEVPVSIADSLATGHQNAQRSEVISCVVVYVRFPPQGSEVAAAWNCPGLFPQPVQ